jgi:deoxyribodipyrimidine photo-lyase
VRLADSADLALDFTPALSELPWAASVDREGKSHTPQPGQGPSAFPWSGGETSGLARVEQYFFKSDSVANYFGTRNGMLGTDYSTKFSPWLACGALSPRYIQSRLSEYERTVTENKSTYWVRFELTWRDFFWFFALKHGAKIFQPSGLKHPSVRLSGCLRNCCAVQWCAAVR